MPRKTETDITRKTRVRSPKLTASEQTMCVEGVRCLLAVRRVTKTVPSAEWERNMEVLITKFPAVLSD